MRLLSGSSQQNLIWKNQCNFSLQKYQLFSLYFCRLSSHGNVLLQNLLDMSNTSIIFGSSFTDDQVAFFNKFFIF